MTALIRKEDAPAFTEQEIEELNKYVDGGGHNIAPSTAVNFLALYLEGRSLEEIHKRFQQWPKGALLLARYTYQWDLEKDRYIREMTRTVAERLVKTKIDAVQFLQDRLAVSHKEFAKDMEKYLQNPTDDNLPNNRIKSMRDYRDTVKALQELAELGRPSSDPLSGSPSVTVNVNSAGEKTEVTISPTERETVLDKLLDDKKDAKPK